MMDVGWTVFFQILNTLLWVGIIYFIFSLAIKLPKRIKINEEKIEKIEQLLDEIKKKIDN